MRKALAVFLMIAIVLSLSACNGSSPSYNAGETRVFTDDCGREVSIPVDVSRIVPSGPLAQVILFAIAPDMFVGLAAKWTNAAQGYVAEEYLKLPYFGQMYNSANMNVEELAAADPQIIIDIGEAMDGSSEDLDSLYMQTNIPTVFISASLDSMPDTFRKLGKLLNREEKAEELALFCERVYNRTISIMDKVGANKVKSLYVLGEKGLNVLAYQSYHSELVDFLTDNLAVLNNPVSKGSGNEVTMEQIAIWNPEFVLFASDSIYDTVKQLDAWSEINAIAKGNYIEVPEGPHNWMGGPPAVQRYLGLIWLTAELYPQYSDYNVKDEIVEYYKLFYHHELTEEQYNELTSKAFIH